MLLRTLAAALTCMMILFSVVGCKSNKPLESSNLYAHDDAITARVKSVLLQDPTLHRYTINVETQDRIVTLSGYVDSPITVDRATAVVQDVHGVRSVHNNLAVKH